MVKFKWPFDKISVQRMILLSIIGVISCGILRGHMNHEREVSEYMRSLEYRRAREASHDYKATLLKSNQRLFSSDEDSAPSVDRE